MDLGATLTTVKLSADAYNALASLKGENESFSDVVRRLTGIQVPLSAFAGAWVGAPRDTVGEVQAFLLRSDQLSRSKLRRLARRKSTDA
jgi:predicted CopG family antitoxin